MKFEYKLTIEVIKRKDNSILETYVKYYKSIFYLSFKLFFTWFNRAMSFDRNEWTAP